MYPYNGGSVFFSEPLRAEWECQMGREFQRSQKTNELFDRLVAEGIIFRLDVPEVGVVELDGEHLREFLWTIRSNKSTALFEEWLRDLKKTILAYKAKKSRPRPAPRTAPSTSMSTSAVSMRGSE